LTILVKVVDELAGPDDLAGPHVWRSLDAVFRRGGADMRRLTADSLPEMRGSIAALLETIPHDGCRQSELARTLGVTKQAVGQRLAEVTSLGYVSLCTDRTDGRAQVVALTEQGRSVRQSIRQFIAAMEAEWSAEVGAADYAVFRSVLDRLGTPTPALNPEQT
jgi:DNA-binding MarR family transcriptional regulator